MAEVCAIVDGSATAFDGTMMSTAWQIINEL
jgi:hypothetical protein